MHANLELLQIDNVKKECVTQGWLDIAWQDHALAKKMNVHQVQLQCNAYSLVMGIPLRLSFIIISTCIFPSVSKS